MTQQLPYISLFPVTLCDKKQQYSQTVHALSWHHACDESK
ncbi:hypothetical protein C3B79_1404 [Aeromonas hydrophila]|nr:hypothetical protein C3B79_1404 [Aeromonas hydrophila]